jgi:hypothetical protein
MEVALGEEFEVDLDLKGASADAVPVRACVIGSNEHGMLHVEPSSRVIRNGRAKLRIRLQKEPSTLHVVLAFAVLLTTIVMTTTQPILITRKHLANRAVKISSGPSMGAAVSRKRGFDLVEGASLGAGAAVSDPHQLTEVLGKRLHLSPIVALETRPAAMLRCGSFSTLHWILCSLFLLLSLFLCLRGLLLTRP